MVWWSTLILGNKKVSGQPHWLRWRALESEGADIGRKPLRLILLIRSSVATLKNENPRWANKKPKVKFLWNCRKFHEKANFFPEKMMFYPSKISFLMTFFTHQSTLIFRFYPHFRKNYKNHYTFPTK